MNRILLILLLLISTSCRIDSTDVINDQSKIPDEIRERISSQKLIKADERILTVFHDRTVKLPSFESTNDEFYLLTNERFLRHYTYDGKDEIQEVKFGNCLDIALDSTTVLSDYFTYHIAAKSIELLVYDENEQLKLIPNFNHIHYGGNNKYRTDFQNLNSLVIKTWQNHAYYDSLRTIYMKFYDDNGKYRTE